MLFVVLGNTSFVQQLPENGQIKWPKHVGGFRRI